jgi:branched-subunit amino acid transport protein
MTIGPWDAYVAATAGAVATYAWRAFGVAIGGRLDPDGRIFAWLGCVAYAVLAALILRLVVFPAGSLAQLSPSLRIAAALAAAAIFLLTRRRILPGCLAGSGAIAIGAAMS